jgi:DUF4097 and DUF4098 domain-containing protein YvlB
VSVTGITGAVTVTDGLGDVRLDNLAGPVTATTDLGNIGGSNLRCLHASLTADLGNIDLAFSAPPVGLAATDQRGNITLRVPATTSYRVTAQALLGSTSVTVPRQAASTHVIYASSRLGDVTVMDWQAG